MKKIKIILSLALLISITCIAGMANKSNRTSQDSLKLRLLEATEHRIQINCPQLNKRVYIIDDLTLLKKDIVNNKVCFFLSSEFTVSDVILVDKDIQLMEYKNAKYYDFNPQIDFELFSSFMNKTRLYKLVFNNVDDLPESFNIRIKYHIIGYSGSISSSEISNRIYFKGIEFWYPRNIYQDENLFIYVKTTDKIAFYLNNKAVNYTRKQYLKEYTAELTDLSNNPANILFKKSELK